MARGLFLHAHNPSFECAVFHAASFNLGLDRLRDCGARVHVSHGDAHIGEGLKVSDGWSVSSGDKLLAMAFESATNDLHELLPVVVDEVFAVLRKRLSSQDGGSVSTPRFHEVFTEVDDGVNTVDDHRFVGVVAMADGKHAEDGATVRHAEAIFFPDGN